MTSGILEVSAEGYHAGDEGAPRLSASIAHILCTQSPAHAREAHPRLNPNYERKEEERFDVGKAAHSILLEGDDCIYVVHEDSWRKTVAKEARDYARSINKVPLLAANRDEVMRMVEAVRTQLATHRAGPPVFADGQAEASILWEEGDVACKARLDWLRTDLLFVDDLKTRSQVGGAATEKWERGLYQHGAHIQAYVYPRAVEVATGITPPTFRWCLVETSPPYALSVIEPAGDVIACGKSDWEYALELWRECIKSGDWPAYPNTVARIEAPPWELERRVQREEMAA